MKLRGFFFSLQFCSLIITLHYFAVLLKVTRYKLSPCSCVLSCTGTHICREQNETTEDALRPAIVIKHVLQKYDHYVTALGLTRQCGAVPPIGRTTPLPPAGPSPRVRGATAPGSALLLWYRLTAAWLDAQERIRLLLLQFPFLALSPRASRRTCPPLEEP